jgi:hypothetical protein
MAINQVDIRDDQRFYYQAMRKTIVQFLDLFDGMAIARYDTESGQLLKYVSVPFKFAPKSKHWYWEEKVDDETGQRIRDKILPMMACNLVNVEPSTNRLVNVKHRARTRSKQDNNIERFFNPVPYDYSFEVNIAAEYMVDITQIMERILPFFDNYIFIRLTIPELDIVSDDIDEGAHPLDLKVIYEGSSKEETLDFEEADYRIIMWTLQFKVEGYLFKPKYEYPIIKKSFMEYVIDEPGVVEPGITTLTTALSAEKYPLPVDPVDMNDALYDEDIKLFYKYEKEGE